VIPDKKTGEIEDGAQEKAKHAVQQGGEDNF
jgi:hypothetical protein